MHALFKPNCQEGAKPKDLFQKVEKTELLYFECAEQNVDDVTWV